MKRRQYFAVATIAILGLFLAVHADSSVTPLQNPQLPPQTSRLTYTVDPSLQVLTARIQRAADAKLATKVSFSLSDSGGTLVPPSPKSFTVPATTADFPTAEFPIAALAPGDYHLSATIVSGGGSPNVTLTAKVVKPPLDWMGGRLGLLSPDQVPPPWSPVGLNESPSLDVSTTGRTYRFDAAVLPVQIFSQKRPLLAAPMGLVVQSEGQSAPVAWTGGSPAVVSSSSAAVDLQGTATSGALTLKTAMHIEYDGLMTVKLSLTGPVPPNARISLEIPIAPGVALYEHRSVHGTDTKSGGLPLFSGIVDSDRFSHFVWIGDNDRGLSWLCESGEKWPNQGDARAMEIERRSDAVVLRLNLLAAGQTLPPNWSFDFGLQATPVKPFPPGWRKWKLAPTGSGRTTLQIMLPSETVTTKYYGYPQAEDPVAYRAKVAGINASGKQAIQYGLLSLLVDQSPEWNWFQKEWWLDIYGTMDAQNFGKLYSVDPKSQSYRDFIVPKSVELLNQAGLAGYYHDQMVPYADWGAWKDSNGVSQPAFPILAMRELQRRLYVAVKASRPESFLMGHMSRWMNPAVLAYEDAYLDGEQFIFKFGNETVAPADPASCSHFQDPSYMNALTLDGFRAEFMGRQFGIVPFFLPQFRCPDQFGLATPTRELMALLMLHDVPLWGDYVNAKEVGVAYGALDEFGYEEALFLPYFGSHPPVSTDMPDVLVSVYRRTDGTALAVLGNLSKSDQSGTVTIDPKQIGILPRHAVSWPDGAAFPTGSEPAEFAVSVPKRDYRLVKIEGAVLKDFDPAADDCLCTSGRDCPPECVTKVEENKAPPSSQALPLGQPAGGCSYSK